MDSKEIHIHIHPADGSEASQVIQGISQAKISPPPAKNQGVGWVNIVLVLIVMMVATYRIGIENVKSYVNSSLLEKKISLDLSSPIFSCEKGTVEKFIFPENSIVNQELCNNGCRFSVTPFKENFFIGVNQGQACYEAKKVLLHETEEFNIMNPSTWKSPVKILEERILHWAHLGMGIIIALFSIFRTGRVVPMFIGLGMVYWFW